MYSPNRGINTLPFVGNRGSAGTLHGPIKTEKENGMETRLPNVGDEIYVPTELYLSHGMDDFCGGLARVTAVKEGISGGKTVHFIQIAERPGSSYNWEQYLVLEQEKLKARFGKSRAHPDPDDRPEFNRWD